MPELLLALVDERDGDVLIDTTNPEIAEAIQADLSEQLGNPDALACARPLNNIVTFAPYDREGGPTIRVSSMWHESLIEGPGQRSVLRMQGCPIRCKGCYVPETWNPNGGVEVSIETIANALLLGPLERDGVTILGGEPFAQPAALHDLVRALRQRQPDLHILVYSGLTLDALRLLAENDLDIACVLESIDMLIDGPYIAALAGGASDWTGSSNQRVLTRINQDGASAFVPYTQPAATSAAKSQE